MYGLLADCVLLLHLGFVLFVIGGGFLAWRWRWLCWLHVPAVAWGFVVEAAGFTCPLTPLENRLRLRAGETMASGDFVARSLLPVLYPEDLTRPVQLGLAALVLAVNLVAYARWINPPRS